jgi:3-methyl-2-oxobutanoate hydroxymethyltransferase
MAGYETTLPITLDNMIYHAASVVQGYQPCTGGGGSALWYLSGDSKEALVSAIRIMKETGASAIKVEGGVEIKESIERILSAGIPVMGHLGLTPQAIHKFGTYVVRATEKEEAEKLKSDAKALAQTGCFAIVLEKIPASLAGEVTESISIPTIGIGAGVDVSGQVLVLHDMLGITQEFSPRFLRRYHNLQMEIKGAVTNYINDVRSQEFPNESEQY